MSQGALAGLRVLDLTDEMGVYTPKLLADLGADVICVEPPEGSPVRRLPPFYRGQPGAEDSLFHWWMNTSKRSVVADLDTSDGQGFFRDLVRSAQILVTSGAPAALARRGLTYTALAEVNPGLVMTTITPFGLDGALADYAADDLVLLAMGGLMYLAGYPGEHPTAVYGYQSYLAGSLFGAVGTLIAAYEAAESGLGQLVEVSIQEAVAHALESAAQQYDLNGVVRQRTGANQQGAGFGLYPCQDGLVFLAIGLVGGQVEGTWRALTSWLADVPEAAILSDPRWLDGQYRGTAEAERTFYEIFARYTRDKTKQELYRSGQALGVTICPVCTLDDLAHDEQLLARDFFVRVDHPELGASFLYPGAPYRLQRTPWRISRRAPRLGEHTAQLRAELLETRKEAG